MILKNLYLIFVFGFINIDFGVGYKCEFYKSWIEYSCIVYPETSDIIEQHDSDHNDNMINAITFNGDLNRISRLTQSELLFFGRFKNIIHYDFYGIDDVPVGFFSNYSQLVTLELTDGTLTTLPENIFANQRELRELNLPRNKINFLPSKIFKALESLKNLYLNKNNISRLPANIFESLKNLERLELDNNKISDLPKNVFKSLRNLKYVKLANNRLKTIHFDSFGPQKGQSILLEGNPINAMDKKLIAIEPDISMPENSCSLKTGYIWRDEIQELLKKCFENYQPREE